jgi:hypothetical protein
MLARTAQTCSIKGMCSTKPIQASWLHHRAAAATAALLAGQSAVVMRINTQLCQTCVTFFFLYYMPSSCGSLT